MNWVKVSLSKLSSIERITRRRESCREGVFLKVSAAYQFFAIQNLCDANCECKFAWLQMSSQHGDS